jgi:hypothetical protein
MSSRSGLLRLRVLLNNRMVGRVLGGVVMTAGKQQPAFQVFECGLKLDAAASDFPSNSMKAVPGRHWPLLGKKTGREPKIRCAGIDRCATTEPAVECARADL